MPVPTDIAIAYLIQGSFYGHSIYATIYMDAWRKDSAVMVVHHIITLALICFSYAFRYFVTDERSERTENISSCSQLTVLVFFKCVDGHVTVTHPPVRLQRRHCAVSDDHLLVSEMPEC